MRNLLLIPLLLVLSCKSSQTNSTADLSGQTEPDIKLNNSWILEQVNGTAVEKMTYNSTPTLEINIEEKRINGSDGCNNFFGELDELDAKRIVMRVLGSTKAYCPEIKNSDMLGQYLYAVRTYKVDKKGLCFFNDAGVEILRYRKAE
jgi:heat shock protein HslJ